MTHWCFHRSLCAVITNGTLSLRETEWLRGCSEANSRALQRLLLSFQSLAMTSLCFALGFGSVARNDNVAVCHCEGGTTEAIYLIQALARRSLWINNTTFT